MRFDFTDDEGLSQVAKDAFSKSTQFTIRRPTPNEEGMADLIFVIDDREFPFTTNEPIHDNDGLLWEYQVDLYAQHIVFHIKLTDEDRTKETRKFSLVICPFDKDENVVTAVKKMVAVGRNLKLILYGKHFNDVALNGAESFFAERISHPDLMRHMAIGSVNVSAVSLGEFQKQISYRKVNPVMRKYCPTCQKL